MNYMKQVAEMLGVEMGERFNITSKIDGHQQRDDYYFTDEGLMREGFTALHRRQLADILTGNVKIIKKPWKPGMNEKYWYIWNNGEIVCSNCTNHTFDLINILIGNCFRTTTDALSHKDEIMAKFKAVME